MTDNLFYLWTKVRYNCIWRIVIRGEFKFKTSQKDLKQRKFICKIFTVIPQWFILLDNCFILPLVAQIQALTQQAYALYAPQVEYIINAQIKDEKKIQGLLDGLLDFCSDEQFLMLFKKLCRYYWAINPYETAEYIQIYREL